MTEQIKIEQPKIEQINAEQVLVLEKINLKDIEFDNISEEELCEIKEEIETVIKIRQLKCERMEQIKKQIMEEKEILMKKMIKEINKEKAKLKEESEEESEEDGIVYDKKSTKGRVVKAKPRSRVAAKKK